MPLLDQKLAGTQSGNHPIRWLLLLFCGQFFTTESGTAIDYEAPLPVAIADSPALSRVWHGILNEAGLNTMVVAVPQGRRRRLFVDGFILLDCCAVPAFRDRPEEQAVQLFSDSFYEVKEHYVFRRGEAVPITDPEQLRNYRFAGVRGFEYGFSNYLSTRIDGRSVDDVLTLIHKGRANIGTINDRDFAKLMAENPRDVELGEIIFTSGLRIRLHKSRSDLLPRINAAIARLNADNRMKKMVE